LGLGFLAVPLVLLGLVQGTLSGQQKKDDDEKITCQIIYVPTEHATVIKMLEMAKVAKDDVVFDLGCGDGRIISLAVGSVYFDRNGGDKEGKHQSPFQAKRGVGVDIDPDRMKDSEATLKKNGFSNIKAETDSRGIKHITAVLKTKGREAPVEFRRGDALKVKDLGDASVVMLYMLQPFMDKLEPIAQKTLKPGTRIVAHDFAFPNWKPEQTVNFKGPNREHRLFLYVVKGGANQ
jgi:SAM-dependent methyltransferase